MVNRLAGSNMPGMQGPGQHLQQQQDYPGQQQPGQPYQQQQQSNQPYQQQPPGQGYQQQPGFGAQGPQFQQQQQQQQQPGQSFMQQGLQVSMQPGGPQGTSKPMRGIPAVIPSAQSKTQPPTQGQQQPQQQSTGPNLMQKFTEMAGASAGGDILSKGKELIFMKFGLGK